MENKIEIEIITKLLDNNDVFIKCHKIYKQIPPAKNENKFAFGILIQMSIIDCLNKLFYKCEDLDNNHSYGSEYKNDCCLYLDEIIKVNISIKAKSKKSGNIIIINNYSSKKERNLSDLITIILIIETNMILILPHLIIPEEFIINNDANIIYKGSLINYIIKNKPELLIKLKENEKFINFINNDLPLINSINIYKDLYDKL